MRQNWLEWVVLGVSLGILVLLVGYLAFSGLSGSRPAMPRADVQASGGPGADGGWLVPVTVRNDGHRAAVTVVVEGTATVAGTDESSEVTVDILAAESEVDIVLGFSGPPDAGVQLRIVGFEAP
ncbi:MAG TPA: hypothetical protein VIB02_02140 [Candidatus Limnocylindrales bacterium]|jgi:uncharacterized protein (TIGR02588 family)